MANGEDDRVEVENNRSCDGRHVPCGILPCLRI